MESAIRGVKAVVFDMYQTLVTVSPPMQHKQALAKALGVGLDIVERTMERYREAYELGKVETHDRMAAIASKGHMPPKLEDLIELEQHHCIQVAHLYAGVETMLVRLRRGGYQLGLCSNANPIGRVTAYSLGLMDLMDGAAFSCEVGVTKPTARIYEAVCGQLKVRPHDCLYVDDGGSDSIQGATELGMQTCLVMHPDGYAATNPDNSIKADFVVGSVALVASLLTSPAPV